MEITWLRSNNLDNQYLSTYTGWYKNSIALCAKADAAPLLYVLSHRTPLNPFIKSIHHVLQGGAEKTELLITESKNVGLLNDEFLRSVNF